MQVHVKEITELKWCERSCITHWLNGGVILANNQIKASELLFAFFLIFQNRLRKTGELLYTHFDTMLLHWSCTFCWRKSNDYQWKHVLSCHSYFILSVEVKVNFDYDAEQHDELTIRVGDIIKNVSTPEGGWWEGELNGKKGLFPDNFVEVSLSVYE